MKHPEEWLKEYAKNDDLDKEDGNVLDRLWANNVLEYMKQYAIEAHNEAIDGVKDTLYYQSAQPIRAEIFNYLEKLKK